MFIYLALAAVILTECAAQNVRVTKTRKCPDTGFFYTIFLGLDDEALCYLCFCKPSVMDAACFRRAVENCRIDIFDQENGTGIFSNARNGGSESLFRKVVYEYEFDPDSSCIPYVSGYTNCTTNNQCSGCTTSECDGVGKWNCEFTKCCSVDCVKQLANKRTVVTNRLESSNNNKRSQADVLREGVRIIKKKKSLRHKRAVDDNSDEYITDLGGIAMNIDLYNDSLLINSSYPDYKLTTAKKKITNKSFQKNFYQTNVDSPRTVSLNNSFLTTKMSKVTPDVFNNSSASKIPIFESIELGVDDLKGENDKSSNVQIENTNKTLLFDSNSMKQSSDLMKTSVKFSLLDDTTTNDTNVDKQSIFGKTVTSSLKISNNSVSILYKNLKDFLHEQQNINTEIISPKDQTTNENLNKTLNTYLYNIKSSNHTKLNNFTLLEKIPSTKSMYSSNIIEQEYTPLSTLKYQPISVIKYQTIKYFNDSVDELMNSQKSTTAKLHSEKNQDTPFDTTETSEPTTMDNFVTEVDKYLTNDKELNKITIENSNFSDEMRNFKLFERYGVSSYDDSVAKNDFGPNTTASSKLYEITTVSATISKPSMKYNSIDDFSVDRQSEEMYSNGRSESEDGENIVLNITNLFKNKIKQDKNPYLNFKPSNKHLKSKVAFDEIKSFIRKSIKKKLQERSKRNQYANKSNIFYTVNPTEIPVTKNKDDLEKTDFLMYSQKIKDYLREMKSCALNNTCYIDNEILIKITLRLGQLKQDVFDTMLLGKQIQNLSLQISNSAINNFLGNETKRYFVDDANEYNSSKILSLINVNEGNINDTQHFLAKRLTRNRKNKRNNITTNIAHLEALNRVFGRYILRLGASLQDIVDALMGYSLSEKKIPGANYGLDKSTNKLTLSKNSNLIYKQTSLKHHEHYDDCLLMKFVNRLHCSNVESISKNKMRNKKLINNLKLVEYPELHLQHHLNDDSLRYKFYLKKIYGGSEKKIKRLVKLINPSKYLDTESPFEQNDQGTRIMKSKISKTYQIFDDRDLVKDWLLKASDYNQKPFRSLASDSIKSSRSFRIRRSVFDQPDKKTIKNYAKNEIGTRVKKNVEPDKYVSNKKENPHKENGVYIEGENKAIDYMLSILDVILRQNNEIGSKAADKDVDLMVDALENYYGSSVSNLSLSRNDMKHSLTVKNDTLQDKESSNTLINFPKQVLNNNTHSSIQGDFIENSKKSSTDLLHSDLSIQSLVAYPKKINETQYSSNSRENSINGNARLIKKQNVQDQNLKMSSDGHVHEQLKSIVDIGRNKNHKFSDGQTITESNKDIESMISYGNLQKNYEKSNYKLDLNKSKAPSHSSYQNNKQIVITKAKTHNVAQFISNDIMNKSNYKSAKDFFDSTIKATIIGRENEKLTLFLPRVKNVVLMPDKRNMESDSQIENIKIGSDTLNDNDKSFLVDIDDTKTIFEVKGSNSKPNKNRMTKKHKRKGNGKSKGKKRKAKFKDLSKNTNPILKEKRKRLKKVNNKSIKIRTNNSSNENVFELSKNSKEYNKGKNKVGIVSISDEIKRTMFSAGKQLRPAEKYKPNNITTEDLLKPIQRLEAIIKTILDLEQKKLNHSHDVKSVLKTPNISYLPGKPSSPRHDKQKNLSMNASTSKKIGVYDPLQKNLLIKEKGLKSLATTTVSINNETMLNVYDRFTIMKKNENRISNDDQLPDTLIEDIYEKIYSKGNSFKKDTQYDTIKNSKISITTDKTIDSYTENLRHSSKIKNPLSDKEHLSNFPEIEKIPNGIKATLKYEHQGSLREDTKQKATSTFTDSTKAIMTTGYVGKSPTPSMLAIGSQSAATPSQEKHFNQKSQFIKPKTVKILTKTNFQLTTMAPVEYHTYKINATTQTKMTSAESKDNKSLTKSLIKKLALTTENKRIIVNSKTDKYKHELTEHTDKKNYTPTESISPLLGYQKLTIIDDDEIDQQRSLKNSSTVIKKLNTLNLTFDNEYSKAPQNNIYKYSKVITVATEDPVTKTKKVKLDLDQQPLIDFEYYNGELYVPSPKHMVQVTSNNTNKSHDVFQSGQKSFKETKYKDYQSETGVIPKNNQPITVLPITKETQRKKMKNFEIKRKKSLPKAEDDLNKIHHSFKVQKNVDTKTNHDEKSLRKDFHISDFEIRKSTEIEKDFRISKSEIRNKNTTVKPTLLGVENTTNRNNIESKPRLVLDWFEPKYENITFDDRITLVTVSPNKLIPTTTKNTNKAQTNNSRESSFWSEYLHGNTGIVEGFPVYVNDKFMKEESEEVAVKKQENLLKSLDYGIEDATSTSTIQLQTKKYDATEDTMTDTTIIPDYIFPEY